MQSANHKATADTAQPVDAVNGSAKAQAPVLTARGVGKDFIDAGNTLTVLDDVDLDIHAGEMVAIMGASGSGKSTLLHILGLLDRPTRGRILVRGQPTQKISEQALSELRNQHFGFVYQFHHLLAEFNALDNVAMPLIIRGESRSQARQAADELLHQVGLGQRSTHFPNQLSGGERQRVAIARALVTRPSCVLADEPTGNLDAETAQEVFEVLQAMNEQLQTAFLLVTHDRALANRAAHQYVMHQGALAPL
ncbi:MAG TPA: ATP-binding cassette domain-containing protein [Paenalcaligenes sp.]|nr:ATP-binding cassette domain-containing protein [Paenalcaligenes sp.]